MNVPSTWIIETKNISRIYNGSEEIRALDNISLKVPAGELAAVMGPSGSGKSTLLNMIGCLDRPTSGSLSVNNTNVNDLDRNSAAKFRGQNIGFIFQDFNLIPVLTVAENIEYPLLMVQNWAPQERQKRIRELMDAVGINDQADKYPDQLSGGQKQRVAIARALVTHAKLILADEPTANLDHDTAYRIIDLMKKMRDDYGTTFIFSTHDHKIIEAAEIIYTLEDGEVNQTKGGNHE